MNRKNLLALMIWAIDVDSLSINIEKNLEWFLKDAWEMYKTYTDPSDELLYCPNIVGQNPLDMFTDYILMYAKMHVQSGILSYGKLDIQILNN